MGAHDREITDGRKETIEGGVILRFPGDWVGPLEELVPFGPSADRESPSSTPDFWGEDSAALQDAVDAVDAVQVAHAVEMPKPPRRREPVRLRRWLLAAGGVVAAVLFAVAAALSGSPASAPHARAVQFAIASIPALATAPRAVAQRPARHRTPPHPQRHPRTTHVTTASTDATATPAPVTTFSPTYHPATASTSSAGNSSQGGGAFTLGGP